MRPALFYIRLMAGNCVFQRQFLFLEPVKQGVVGVGAMLFKIDLGMERRMLGCEGLDVCLVHRSISFRWLTRDSDMNKTRKRGFVSIDHSRFGGCAARFAARSIGHDGQPFVS